MASLFQHMLESIVSISLSVHAYDSSVQRGTWEEGIRLPLTIHRTEMPPNGCVCFLATWYPAGESICLPLFCRSGWKVHPLR